MKLPGEIEKLGLQLARYFESWRTKTVNQEKYRKKRFTLNKMGKCFKKVQIFASFIEYSARSVQKKAHLPPNSFYTYHQRWHVFRAERRQNAFTISIVVYLLSVQVNPVI